MTEGDQQPGGEEAKVFLSYSRKDRERAARFAEVLRARRFVVFRDTDDILPTEEWKQRLEQLISEADTIVFLLSPHSAASDVCAWEVEQATALSKRIAPIVIEEVEAADIPPLLARLNFIFCTDRDPFENAVDTLVSALNSDIGWVREHTRLAGLAARWDGAGRPARLFLRGQDIADAEAWRDGHPPEAPQVTPLQAALISASRRGAVRRQRYWLGGSIAVAASTAALAVFAWFLSVEADRQRFEAQAQSALAEEQRREAETQRAAAEEQRAEADRQRNLAVEQRNIALERLAADRLRAGDRAGALIALVEARPDPPQRDVLLAGLEDGRTLLERIGAGTPFLLNGQLYLAADEGAALRLPGLPARWHETVGDATLFITDTGALLLRQSDGTLVEAAASGFAVQPCFVDRKADGAIDLYGGFYQGYSACGPRLVAQPVTDAGFGESVTYLACTEQTVAFSAALEQPFPVDGVAVGCAYDDVEQARLDPLHAAEVASIRALTAISSFTFPLPGEEAALWVAEGPDDMPGVVADAIERLRSLGLSPADYERFPLTSLDAVSHFDLPDIVETASMTVAARIAIWGGTGGEVHRVCAGARGGGLRCQPFHSFGGFSGIRVSRNEPRAVVFGQGLSRDDSQGTGQHNVWITEGTGGAFMPLRAVAPYGRALAAAFGPEDKLAVLTENTVVILDLASGDTTLMIPPPGAASLEWLQNGEFAVLTPDALYFAQPGESFARVALDGMPAMPGPDSDEPAPNLWLREVADGGLLIVGANDTVQIFDTSLQAPLTGRAALSEPQLEFSANGVEARRMENGAIEISVNGRTYRRTGADPGADVAAYTDPDTPLGAR